MNIAILLQPITCVILEAFIIATFQYEERYTQIISSTSANLSYKHLLQGAKYCT